MKRLVLVTGAAGEVGRRLVERLLADGHRVRGLVLPNDRLRSRLDGLDVDIVEGDVRQPASLIPAVEGVDTVLHLAAVILGRHPAIFDAVNRSGTAHLVAAAAAVGVQHFIYVSSASVVYPRLTPYGRSKLQAEGIVASEPRMRHTIVRPTLVYDDSGGGQEFALFRSYLHRFPVVPFIGPTRGPRAARKRPVHASDVVDALARMVGNPGTWGQTLNISGPETITLADLGRLLLGLENHPKTFLPIPVAFCRFVAAALGAIMNDPPLTPYGIAGFTNHADLDPSETMRLLGWQPRDLRTGLRATGATLPRGLPWRDGPMMQWSRARAAASSAEGRSE